MARAGEVVGTGRGVDQRVHGGGAVRGRDAGGGAVARVDGHGERGALRLGVVGDHQGQLERVAAVALERETDHAAGVADHEGHRLGRDLLGRHDEVALVLAVGVVDHDHELAPLDGGDRVLDVGEGHQESCSLGIWLPMVGVLGVRSRSTYLARTSTSRFTPSPGLAHAERGDREGVRHERDAEASAARSARPTAGDGEADAVDGDRALLDQVAAEAVGQPHGQSGRAVGLRGARDHGADAVDVALHDVAAEPVGEADRALEVHRVTGGRGRRCVVRSRVSAWASAAHQPSPCSTTVRQQPLTAMDAPSAASSSTTRGVDLDACAAVVVRPPRGPRRAPRRCP